MYRCGNRLYILPSRSLDLSRKMLTAMIDEKNVVCVVAAKTVPEATGLRNAQSRLFKKVVSMTTKKHKIEIVTYEEMENIA